MQSKNRGSLERSLQKLKAEKLSLKDRLALLRKENRDLERSLRNRGFLLNAMPAGIIILQQGKILEMNEMLLEQLGYKAEEVVGRNFFDFIHPDQRGYVRGLHSMWDSGKMSPEQYDAILMTRDDDALHFDIRVERIRLKNRKAFLLNLTRLEKRKELEREKLLLKKMEALTTMASGLSKELNSCFNDIIGNIQDLRAVRGAENGSLLESLKEVESGSLKVQAIVRELEVLAGMKHDRHGMISCDLNRMVKEAVASTIPKWKDGPGNNGINIDLKTYLRSSSSVEGNPGEIEDVIVSMVKNAVEAMPEGGEILISTEDSAGYAHIFIQDSGEGISPRYRDRLFDPFFTTKGLNSAGLGLSLSYAVIKRHNGGIEMSSEEGQGTIFHVKLPISRWERKNKPKADRKKIKEAQILIIQGEDIAGELLSQLLTCKGCKVDTALNGIEGLGKLKRKKFDMVVADADRLHVEGRMFLEKGRKINPDLIVVLIGKDEDHRTFDQGNNLSTELSISKPIDVNRAVKQIAELLMVKR